MKNFIFVFLLSIAAFAQDDNDDPGLNEPVRPHTEEPKLTTSPSKQSDFFHITWDLGASFGSYRQHTYRELNAGVSLWLYEWFAWRNTAFYRFVEPQNYFGIDTSGQFHYTTPSDLIPISIWAGPGYRFSTGAGGNSAPFVEGGVTSNLPVISFGFGLKVIFQSVVDKNLPDDTQMVIFVNAGGG